MSAKCLYSGMFDTVESTRHLCLWNKSTWKSSASKIFVVKSDFVINELLFFKLKLHCTPGNIVFSFFFSSGYEWNKISEVLNCVLPLSVCVLLPGMCAVEVLVQRGHYVCWEITLAKHNVATLESFLYPVFSFVRFTFHQPMYYTQWKQF